MRTIVVDDEQNALENLREMLVPMPEVENVSLFHSAEAALAYMKGNSVDVAFLDIEMYGTSGLALAKRIKEICPATGIIFVTGHPQYALDAFTLHANGYLLKPATAERIRAEFENLKSPFRGPKPEGRIRVQTFGNFEAFADGKPMHFRYSKTKELFAYLIDRRGAAATTGELCAVLWEDRPETLSLKNQLRNSIADLSQRLREADASQIFIKKRNSFAVDMKALDCDYYKLLGGDAAAVNAYAGEYMAQYSWAEMTLGGLTR